MKKDREEFERWADTHNQMMAGFLKKNLVFSDVYVAGSESRQPEIDALKKEVLTYRNLAGCWRDKFNHQSDEKLKLVEENAVLKEEIDMRNAMETK